MTSYEDAYNILGLYAKPPLRDDGVRVSCEAISKILRFEEHFPGLTLRQTAERLVHLGQLFYIPPREDAYGKYCEHLCTFVHDDL